MISILPEPMPITHGHAAKELLLIGVSEDDYGFKGLAVDTDGELTVLRLEWPIICDWRFDAERDEWNLLAPKISIESDDE